MLVYQNENIGKSYAFRSRYHRSGYTIPPHIHEYTELLWVLDGIMTMTLYRFLESFSYVKNKQNQIEGRSA